MEKYLFIGDSHQSALLPIKIALFLGIPFLMGKGYCSSTDWPNVSRFDGNGNVEGMVMVMLLVSFLLYISSTSPEHFPFSIGIQKVLILARPLSDFHFLHIIVQILKGQF